MLTFVFKRLLAMIPTLFGISLVTFLIVLWAPGDPVASKMGQGGGREAVAGAEEQEGVFVLEARAGLDEVLTLDHGSNRVVRGLHGFLQRRAAQAATGVL